MVCLGDRCGADAGDKLNLDEQLDTNAVDDPDTGNRLTENGYAVGLPEAADRSA